MSLDENIKGLLRKQPLAVVRRNMSKFLSSSLLLSLRSKSPRTKSKKRGSMVAYLDEASFKKELN